MSKTRKFVVVVAQQNVLANENGGPAINRRKHKLENTEYSWKGSYT